MKQKLIAICFIVACVSIGSAQEERKSSLIYSVGGDGVLTWHRHDGAATGTGLENPQSWSGGKKVGDGWNEYGRVFPGGADIIYGIKSDGTLEWRKHKGFASGDDEWYPPQSVGRGWSEFSDVFAGGDGVIYVVQSDGILRWYRHLAFRTGGGLDAPGSWATPRDVGRGWTGFKHIFSGGNGVIYVITNDGTLKWYRHKAFLTGEGLETPGAWEGPKDVGRGWSDIEQVFSSGDGVIYFITSEGKLWWIRHYGYLKGDGLENPSAWSRRKEVGRGWGNQLNVFALLPFNDSEESRTPPIVKSQDATTVQGRHGGVQRDDKPRPEELRCRGGSDLKIVVLDGRTNSAGEHTNYLMVTFKPASQPSGAAGRSLQPGDCAFVERTVRTDEPYAIFQEVVSFAQLKQQLHGTPVDTSPTAAERFPDGQSVPRYLSDQNHYWSFFVVQSAPLPLGYFEASASNYWKPATNIRDVITQPADDRRARGRNRVLSPVKP